MSAVFKKHDSIDRESGVIVSSRGGDTESSEASSPTDKKLSRGDSDSASPLKVSVSIRRGRVLVLTMLAVGTILGLTYAFNHGIELSHFDSKKKDAATREKLLDDYNAYSGNFASAFGKPIEVFVAVLVQIMSLRFLAHAFIQPTTSWRLTVMSFAISAVVGYLINNSFNALNVQLHPLEIHARILASDLSVASGLNQRAAALTTNVTHYVPEKSRGNLITNTVLRNAVLPRVTFKQDLCDWQETKSEAREQQVLLPTIDYGFTQRDWQSRILQEALEPETLRIVVNPTANDFNQNLTTAEWPMNASLAADLFVYTIAVTTFYLPWGDTVMLQNISQVESSARLVGLIPPSRLSTEIENREWFLREFPLQVARTFNTSENTSRSDIVVEFSRVQVSPTITFHAVTFEVDLDPVLLTTATSSDNSTRYTDVIQRQAESGYSPSCGPWPALCLVDSPTYKPTDPLEQVLAFGSCVNVNGTDELTIGVEQSFCEEVSNTSMMVFAVGKRLIADSLQQNRSAHTAYDQDMALITNLRKTYSVTVGRLAWKLENLSATFNAECEGDTSSAKCLGLQLPLSSASLRADESGQRDSSKQQWLLVGASSLPSVPSNKIGSSVPHSIPLVTVNDPPFDDTFPSDVLLPHNIGHIEWTNETVADSKCDADVEAHIFTRLNNHMYIEHGFQTAYTAATFYLFQNGVVKNVIESEETQTLSFDGNTQSIALRVSTPDQSAWLTLAGCILLVVGVAAALVLTTHGLDDEKDPLANITSAHVIARVMLDDQRFPALLLHRRAVEQPEGTQHRQLDKFIIAKMTVEDEDQLDQRVTMRVVSPDSHSAV